jgi:hypothetical protein
MDLSSIPGNVCLNTILGLQRWNMLPRFTYLTRETYVGIGVIE